MKIADAHVIVTGPDRSVVSYGHGVTIDDNLSAKYPYKRAYLPVNRLDDEKMWN